MNAKLCLLLFLLPTAWSLKCYICNSVDQASGCGHGKDVSDEYLKDCNDVHEDRVGGANYMFCRKIVTSIDFDVNNNTATERITRKCGYLQSKYDEECYYRAGFGGRQTTCSCKTDKCNGASGLGVVAAPLLVISGAVILRNLY